MPTSYTAAVADGIDFKQFVLRCARAMGACVDMRDEPFSAPIPEKFEPSRYHKDKLEESVAALACVRNMTTEQAEEAALEAYANELSSNTDSLQRIRDLRAKYEDLLKRVQEWKAPTAEHEGLKSFMIDQLVESIRFDCMEDFYQERKPKLKTGEEWRAERITILIKDREHHKFEYAQEVTRAEARSQWIADLRGSL